MINLIDIQESICKALSSITEYTVVDYIEFDSINPPFIRLGNLYFDDNSVKNNEGIKAQQYINIYSTYSGKKEIIQMMDKVNKAMLSIEDIETAYIDGNNQLRTKIYSVSVKQGHLSLGLTKDQAGSIFQRLDRNNNKYYHAVLVYDIYID
ncbi:MAG: hypothetical protein ACI3T9_01470 [Romboutsia timonensis]